MFLSVNETFHTLLLMWR